MTISHELYSAIELDTEVMSASGHRLIQLLLNKGLEHIQIAKAAIANKNTHKKHESITNAKNIVNYLRDCLVLNNNTKPLYDLLDPLYDYLEKNLLLATLKNETEFLESAEKVLLNIKEGWDGMSTK